MPARKERKPTDDERRRFEAQSRGLPADASWEDIATSIMHKYRRRMAAQNGLPPEASWNTILTRDPAIIAAVGEHAQQYVERRRKIMAEELGASDGASWDTLFIQVTLPSLKMGLIKNDDDYSKSGIAH